MRVAPALAPWLVLADNRPWLNTREDVLELVSGSITIGASMSPWLNTTEDRLQERVRLEIRTPLQ